MQEWKRFARSKQKTDIRRKNMAEILKGKPVADAIKADVAERADHLISEGILPTLAILRAGECEDDIAYERRIIKNCEQVHIRVKAETFPEDVSRDVFLQTLQRFSDDSEIHGILVLRPLPEQIDNEEAGRIIRPKKDVDCMNPENLRKVFMGDASAVAPCTPEAVIEILKHYGYTLQGKNVVIANRSLVLGKPLSMLFLDENATVTVCHSRTEELAKIASKADIFVSGIGRPRYFGKEYVSQNTTVIDVGINFAEDGSMCGDMKYDEIVDIVPAITPVPGGIGTVTSSILLRHLIESAELSI